MQNDGKEQKTLFGFPVVEVDTPEIEDKIIIFGDWSNFAVVTNFTPPNKACSGRLALWAKKVRELKNNLLAWLRGIIRRR